MNLLENLKLNPNKIIQKDKLSELRGGSEYECCCLWCDNVYMGACGLDGTGEGCENVDVPENCEYRPGTEC